jgi:cation:H+ antiporter
MVLNVTLFIVGLVVLVAGAEALIRGAVRIARAMGVSPFVIGFTLVGFGTSAPELVVSLSAALKDSPELALGNVVGSNIANIGLILGLAALIRPLRARMRLLWAEIPLMIAVSALLWFLCRDNELSRLDGYILLAGFLVLTVYMYRTAREEPPVVKEELEHAADFLTTGVESLESMTPNVEPDAPVPTVALRPDEPTVHTVSPLVSALLVIVGLAGLIGGAHLMVIAAVDLAKSFGVSEWLIGLTIVAVGTSLPEVAATVAAAWRGESDIALGNVIGSNLFNILFILGITVAVKPMSVSDAAINREIPVMIGFALLALVTVVHGMVIRRWEGALLLLAYAGFVTWQVMAAK